MKKISLMMAMLFCAMILQAQNMQELIAKAGDAKAFPKSDVVVIFDSTSVEMQPTGLSYYQMHKLVKILTLQGAKQNHVVKVGYDPLSAYVEIQKVIVHKANGDTKTIKNPVLD